MDNCCFMTHRMISTCFRCSIYVAPCIPLAWTCVVPTQYTCAYELIFFVNPCNHICPMHVCTHHMHVCPCPCSLAPFMPGDRHPWRPLVLSKQLEWDDLPISGLVREQVCYSKFTNDYLYVDMLAFFLVSTSWLRLDMLLATSLCH